MILPPFKAAADAGAATFMNSFNVVDGIPATGSSHLQRDFLKGQWGFQGFVVSDWGSIGEMVAHGYAADLKDAAQKAITAGSDMDMESRAYVQHLRGDGQGRHRRPSPRGRCGAARAACEVRARACSTIRIATPTRRARSRCSAQPEHVAAARDVARKSIVLLKNDGDVLPLAKTARTIAVIGPLADDKDSPLGNWRAKAESNSAVSLLEGIKAAVSPGTKVVHAQGVKLSVGKRAFSDPMTFETTDRSGIPAAVKAAKGADVVVVAVGEDAFQSGEGRSQVDIGLKGLQEELLKAILDVNKKVVLVLMNGRPLTLPTAVTNGAGDRRDLAGRIAGRERHRRRPVRRLQPVRQAADGLPAARGTAADDLRAQEHRAARARKRVSPGRPTGTPRTTRSTRSATGSATRRSRIRRRP